MAPLQMHIHTDNDNSYNDNNDNGNGNTIMQIDLQKESEINHTEDTRRIEQNTQTPPIFALVPPVWRDGTPKKWSGWRLCRRPPNHGKLENLGEQLHP